MRYCPNCGEEVVTSSRFCSRCGTNLQSRAPKKREVERIVVTQNPPKSTGSIAGIIFLIILVGAFIFAIAVEMFDCPNCNNNIALRWADSYCGGDGKVTFLQMILYSMG